MVQQRKSNSHSGGCRFDPSGYERLQNVTEFCVVKILEKITSNYNHHLTLRNLTHTDLAFKRPFGVMCVSIHYLYVQYIDATHFCIHYLYIDATHFCIHYLYKDATHFCILEFAINNILYSVPPPPFPLGLQSLKRCSGWGGGASDLYIIPRLIVLLRLIWRKYKNTS